MSESKNFENQLITSMITTKKENYMTKAEIKIMGNKSMTEDSQYLKCGGDDRTEN